MSSCASIVLRSTVVWVAFMAGLLVSCTPRRVDQQKTLEGRPVMALMTRIGQPLEDLVPPEGGEGRVISEAQKVWHYLRVSPMTTLTFVHSRYSGWGVDTETVIAQFKTPGIGAISVHAQDQDIETDNGADIGHIKFSISVEAPSPGIAKAEIYPFPRVYNSETMPPSLQIIYPPRFVVPAGSELDPRKKYMRDGRSIATLQNVIKSVFTEGQRAVPLDEP